MSFADKLRNLRIEKKMTQEDLANALGVSKKTISRYENEGAMPRYRKTFDKLAEILGTTHDYLVTDEDDFLLRAREDFGPMGALQARVIVDNVLGLMAGGELPDEDKKAIMEAVQEAYYISKHENKKFSPKRYRKNSDKN